MPASTISILLAIAASATLFSAVLALATSKHRLPLRLFIVANIIGLIGVVLYIMTGFGAELRLIDSGLLFGFSPRVNALSSVFLLLAYGIPALVGTYSISYLERYREAYDPRATVFLLAFFVAGMQGVLLANNAFSFLFFWELMSIASFFLVMMDRGEKSVRAAFLYFIMTHLGASAIMGAFLLIGGGSPFFELSGMKAASSALTPFYSALVFSLFFFGFGSKAGLIPFHVWLPEAHPEAPSNISALMSGLMLKIAIYGFLVVVLGFSQLPIWGAIAVILLSLLSSFLGALSAVNRRDIKGILAYSSIENMGLVFLMIGVAAFFLAQGGFDKIAYVFLAFAVWQALCHALFKTALFLSSGVIISRFHERNIEKMGGLLKRMPIFGAFFLMSILASLPLPPFATFFGEWGFIQGIVAVLHDLHSFPGAAIMLIIVLAVIALVSGLAAFSMVRIYSIVMLGLPRGKVIPENGEKNDLLLIAPIAVLAVSSLLLGVLATPLISGLSSALIGQGDTYADVTGIDLPSPYLGLLILSVFVFVFLIDRFCARRTNERAYHTWDCGQPIDATMQYSATAFSAPIRFFFLAFVGRDKKISSVPVVASNPWITRKSFTLHLRSVWSELLYEPIAKLLLFAANKLKVLQNGRIQYYLLFLLSALVLTIVIAL